MSRLGSLRIALLALLVLLVQGTWTLAGTTGNIEGKVTDQNGNGVAGAKVTAASPSQTLSQITLASGFYSILNLSPDTYAITASKDGYDTSTVYGITVTPDQSTAADIKLRQTVKTLGHITTTATASVVSKSITGDLYSVNSKAINNYNGGAGGAETLYSQNSVVGSLPGVVRNVGTGNGYGGQGSLSVRGGSWDQVGYELDGVPLNRGFDFFNSTTFNTNGLASLQVYTGGAPASEGRAMSGFVNQTYARGKYPGGADFTAVVGSPLFNHTVQADVYGGTPDNRFTYYISTLATNQYVNWGDRSNLANTSFSVPANDPGCGAFNNGPTTAGGFPKLNCSLGFVLNQPQSQGAYASVPFNAGRDTAANLHWGFAHNELNDDLQLLYVVGTGQQPYGLYGVPGSDPSIASALNGNVNASGQITWPTGAFYQGQVGQAYDPTKLLTLTWPTSQGSVNGVVPSTFQDAAIQQYSIEKVGYTRALTEASFLRVYGYKLYSFWTLDQFIQNFTGNSFYQLHDNATGATVDYQNQLDQHNLVKVIGDWSRDLTLRYNYFNWVNSGGTVNCAVGGAPVACAPGTPVVRIGAPLSNWSTVAPLDWDGVISDAYRPSDKLLFDLGLRWDEFAFQLMPVKINGPDGLAYLAEEIDGQCLNGFAYSHSDPAIIGPNGNQNCAGNGITPPLLPTTGKDKAGAAAWQDVTGSLVYTALSPRFGLTFTPDPKDVLRLSVGRYVQPPNSAFEQYRDNPLWGPGRSARRMNQFYDGLGFLAVHDIKPEDSTNYDLSWEHEFAGGLSTKLTPYYRNTRNQVLSIPFDPASPAFTTGDNFGDARIKGAEFLISKAVTGQNGIGATLSATYTDTKIRFHSVNGSSFIDVQNGKTPTGPCLGSGICGYNAAYGTNYPLLDDNGYYSPSYVQSPTATLPSYDVRWVVNLTVDARYGGFDILPTFNYQSGNPYGDPLNFPDAHCPTVGFPNAAATGCIPLKAGQTFYGGNGPDPYTNAFDAPGSLQGPSWWTLNLAVSRDIGHNLKASILGTNLLAGVHNHGYPWEQPTGQQNISYEDNGFYLAAPLGQFGSVTPNPATAYYGNNYYPYASYGILPYRSYVFSLSAKM